jgi:PHP family Zn ribbon phosphoesterase
MTPNRIIASAAKKGIDIIALSDHNSAENAAVAVEIGKKNDMLVFPAMEITSSEEAHTLAIFGDVKTALKMQEIVYCSLPAGIDDGSRGGYQLVVNEKDEILDFNKRLLFGALIFSLKEIVDIVHSLGGIAIASHIDREVFSVISQLGFIPPDIEFDALEISSALSRQSAEIMFGQYSSLPWITSSDAHHLHDVGKRTTTFYLESPSFEELALAIKGQREIQWGKGEND